MLPPEFKRKQFFINFEEMLIFFIKEILPKRVYFSIGYKRIDQIDTFILNEDVFLESKLRTIT